MVLNSKNPSCWIGYPHLVDPIDLHDPLLTSKVLVVEFSRCMMGSLRVATTIWDLHGFGRHIRRRMRKIKNASCVVFWPSSWMWGTSHPLQVFQLADELKIPYFRQYEASMLWGAKGMLHVSARTTDLRNFWGVLWAQPNPLQLVQVNRGWFGYLRTRRKGVSLRILLPVVKPGNQQSKHWNSKRHHNERYESTVSAKLLKCRKYLPQMYTDPVLS